MIDFEKSVVLFQNILEGTRLSQKKPKIIYLSSAAVYGNAEILPINETIALHPISPYGYHKLLCEKLAEEYNQFYNISILVVRLFSIFGKKQKKLLIWELFQQFINDSEVIIKGTGNETRDYIYVDDLADIIHELFFVFKSGFKIINVATGVTYSIKEIVTQIKKLLNSNKEIKIKGDMIPGNPLNWEADISLLQKILGEKKQIDFYKKLEFCINEWTVE